MSAAPLLVWAHGMRAAELHADRRQGFVLAYTAEWLSWPDRYPFSPHLPLDRESSGAEVKNFFENLLPEGTALDVAASTHRLSRHDCFGLLAKIGREAAGALAILPGDEDYARQTELRPLPQEEISARIRQRPTVPFSIWDSKFRLSIAGFQDKLAVHIDAQMNMSLPNGAASSTHIVKPDNANPDFPFMPANEHFCMRLAAKMKLPVPEARLLRIPEPLFCVARFDRRTAKDDNVERLHQIDLCQVLNLPVEMKYQQSYTFSPEGATYADLFRAAASTATPAATELGMIRWAAFNYLIGNTDAHAKNISFFLDHQGLRLAPFYDMVCGTVYGAHDLALFIGEEEDIHLVSSLDWRELCGRCTISPQLLAAELAMQARQWQKWRDSLLDAPDYRDDERAFLRGIAADIDARAERMASQAKEIKAPA